MANNIITINRGDTYSRTVNLKDSSGTLIDATGWTIYFTVRKNITDASISTDTDSIIHKTIAGDVSGVQTLLLTSTDTNVNPRSYFFDIQIKKSDDTIISSSAGSFVVNGDVTRAA